MNTPAHTGLTRLVTVLMGLVAASLTVASALHLSGLDSGAKGDNATAAGVAEAVICVVLAWGTLRMRRRGRAGRSLALGATGFAIAGFAIGLTQTASGGDLGDLLYHAIVLPIIIVIFVLLLFVRREPEESQQLAA